MDKIVIDKDSISIIRQNFGKDYDIILLIASIVFFVCGILLFLTDIKMGLSAVILVALGYVLFEYNLQRFVLNILFFLFVAIFLSYVLDLEFIFLILTTLLLSFGLGFKLFYQDVIKKTEFEIFYLDKQTFKCLSIDYYTYAPGRRFPRDPKSNIKSFQTKKIKTIIIKKSKLIFVFDNQIITPFELKLNEISAIQNFLTEKFSHLLNKNKEFDKAKKVENRFYITKFIIFSPFFIFPLLIYFFADNGRDSTLTLILITLMFITPFIIAKTINSTK